MDKQGFNTADSTQTRNIHARIRHFGRFVAVAIVFLWCLLVSDVYPESKPEQHEEYKIKAAFLYNFLKFVDWPDEKTSRGGKQIIIGIIGEDPFGDTVDLLKGRKVEDRVLIVKQFEGLRQIQKKAEKDEADLKSKIEELKACHLLFICSSEQKELQEIIDIVAKQGVLTVSDTKDFIEAGGIIQFFMQDNKIRFNINLVASEKAGLKIRSQLLRLAAKVIKENKEKEK